MVPSSEVFFEEVREAYAETAASLGLAGPTDTESVLPVSAYTGSGVEYGVGLDLREGTVACTVGIETESSVLTVDIEQLAMAAEVVDVSGRISHSARNLKQLRKSLMGQIEYVRLVHPLMAGTAAEELMRRAGAREWRKPTRA